MENIINDEKKELIKENLKIKNELQISISQYENIKRIHDNLLDEYLDLQVNNNFDKITIFQNEANQLNTENTKMIAEIIELKDKVSKIEIKEKDFYYILDAEGRILPYLNMTGTKEQIIKELKRWKNEIDTDNEFMLKIENKFIEVLETR